jgi:hypothetical protein
MREVADNYIRFTRAQAQLDKALGDAKEIGCRDGEIRRAIQLSASGRPDRVKAIEELYGTGGA